MRCEFQMKWKTATQSSPGFIDVCVISRVFVSCVRPVERVRVTRGGR